MKITTRLVLSFLAASMFPLIIAGYVGLREIDRVDRLAAGEGTECLRRMGEEVIRQKALDVAKQVEIYIKSHPGRTIEELQASSDFPEIAAQKVGNTGYTCLYEAETKILRMHPDRSFINMDMHPLAADLPTWWALVERSTSGSEAAGYYDWIDPNESVRKKYMATVPVSTPLNGKHLVVAATTFVDEFYKPVDDIRSGIRSISSEAARYLFLALLLLGALNAALAWWLARGIARPILAIKDMAIQVAGGDLSGENPVPSNDEIGLMTQALNHMTSELRKLYERYRSLFDGIPVGLYRSTPEGRLLEANEAMVRILGYPNRESLQAVNISESYLDPKDRERWCELMDLQGEVRGFEAQYRRLDGALVWLEDSSRRVKDEREQTVYYEGRLEDVTERRQAEKALRDTEEKYRNIFENALEGIFQVTPEDRFLSVNPALARMLGYSSPKELLDEVSDIGSGLYVRQEQRDEFLRSMHKYKAVRAFEAELRKKDGTTMWASIRARAVLDEQEKLLYNEGSLEDITERKRAEEELKNYQEHLEELVEERTADLAAANKKLVEEIAERNRTEEELQRAKEAAESANRAKSTFLANMSHELRTPLNAIIGYSEMLAEEAEELEPQEFVPDLEKICTAGRHLLSLINDILDISKIEAGKMDLYIEEFDILGLVENVADTIRPLVEKNANKLKIRCDVDLGTMRADVTKVRQSLYNLLSNASKFTENGTITLAVERSESDQGEWVVFNVSDTGIGMTPDQMGRLFQAFTQADASTTRKYGGTGLGLVVTKRFCQLMGGDISVESEYGVGTVFSIKLPVAIVEKKARPAVVAEAGKELPAPAQGVSTVLVIDDDQSVREILWRFLSKEGFRVETASGGKDGLRLARELRPQVITLDVMMPDEDGWAVLAALKSDSELSGIPVVMLSIIDNKKTGFAMGASDYLTKPIDMDLLLWTLQRYRIDTPQPKLLMIEDDAMTRQLVRYMLEKEGLDVSEASNGRIGLEEVARAKPDLILLDLIMPEMDGFEFVDELQKVEAWQSIPIVAITASDLTEKERVRLEGRVKRVLQKEAYDSETLLTVVRNLVRTGVVGRASQSG